MDSPSKDYVGGTCVLPTWAGMGTSCGVCNSGRAPQNIAGTSDRRIACSLVCQQRQPIVPILHLRQVGECQAMEQTKDLCAEMTWRGTQLYLFQGSHIATNPLETGCSIQYCG